MFQSEAATASAAYGRSRQKWAAVYTKHEARANGYSPEEVADLRVESEMAKQYGIPSSGEYPLALASCLV